MGAGKIKTPASIPEPLYEADIYPSTWEGVPEFDILVPAYGKLQLTIDCVNSLYTSTKSSFHLIILNADCREDYGLTHQWVLEFQKAHTNITYCHRKKNWEEGNQFFNLGLKYCKTDYVVTCMNSMTAEPYWDVNALQVMKNDPKIGTIGLKCLFSTGKIESAGIVFRGVMPTDYGRDNPGWQHNETIEMPCCQWAFAMHRKQALAGNLEEDVFNGHVGWDDIDNCMCVRSKGWKIVYCGTGVGIHTPRATRGNNSVDAFLSNQENAHIFYKRWGFWNKHLEEIRMDVKDILKEETKRVLDNAATEYQVLSHLLEVCNNSLSALSEEALKELGVSPDQYALEMNPRSNTWIMRPKIEKDEEFIDPNDVSKVPVKRKSRGNGKGDIKNTKAEVKA